VWEKDAGTRPLTTLPGMSFNSNVRSEERKGGKGRVDHVVTKKETSRTEVAPGHAESLNLWGREKGIGKRTAQKSLGGRGCSKKEESKNRSPRGGAQTTSSVETEKRMFLSCGRNGRRRPVIRRIREKRTYPKKAVLKREKQKVQKTAT